MELTWYFAVQDVWFGVLVKCFWRGFSLQLFFFLGYPTEGRRRVLDEQTLFFNANLQICFKVPNPKIRPDVP